MQTVATPRFNQLVERYYAPLFRFAATLSGNPEAALALTQRTLQLAREHCPHRTAPSNIGQWLFTILFQQFLKGRVPSRRRMA